MNDSAWFNPSQWGVPERWWDVGLYPGSSTALTRWAWEFLRRNPDYRQFWQERLLPFCDPATGEFSDGSLARAESAWDTGEWARAHRERLTPFRIVPLYQQLLSRFGAFGDPRSPYVPRFLAIDVTVVPPGERVEDGERAFLINPNLPLKPQLARIEKILSLGEPKKGKSRLRPELYPSYLQIMDGTEAGASAVEIARRLFPKLNSAATAKQVRKRLAAAREMSTRGYRHLAAATTF